MTTDLPDPHGCPHCGHAGLAERWGETICGMCGAPRVHATPGCPVRNAVAADGETRVLDLRTMKFRTVDSLHGETLAGTIAPEPTGFDRFVADATRIMESAQARCESVIDETARERRVHDGGPRINP